jgi:hypothetical protein
VCSSLLGRLRRGQRLSREGRGRSVCTALRRRMMLPQQNVCCWGPGLALCFLSSCQPAAAPEPGTLPRFFLLAGGVVKQLLDEQGQRVGAYRVFRRGDDVLPGLAMSRSLGDLYAHSVGVSPDPVLSSYTLGERDLFVVGGPECGAGRNAGWGWGGGASKGGRPWTRYTAAVAVGTCSGDCVVAVQHRRPWIWQAAASTAHPCCGSARQPNSTPPHPPAPDPGHRRLVGHHGQRSGGRLCAALPWPPRAARVVRRGAHSGGAGAMEGSAR